MKIKLPNTSVYLVAIEISYDGYDVIAAFKNEEYAKKFINKCKNILSLNKTEIIQIGNYVINEDNVDDLFIVKFNNTNNAGIPFFE